MMTEEDERSPLPLPISPDRLASVRDASLNEAERELYRWVLLRFAAGEGVAGADYVAAAERLGLSPEQATARLEEADLVVRDPVSGDVRCAYPFSGVPTPHRVRLVEQDESLHAMCAVDALGIPFMLHRAATVTSADPRTGREIRVTVGPDAETAWGPDEAVVAVAVQRGLGSLADLCCPLVNFFESEASALAFLAGRPNLDAAIVPIPEAIDLGRAVFEGLVG